MYLQREREKDGENGSTAEFRQLLSTWAGGREETLLTWCRRFSRKLRRAQITSMFVPKNSRESGFSSRERRTSRHLSGKFPRRFTVWLG